MRPAPTLAVAPPTVNTMGGAGGAQGFFAAQARAAVEKNAEAVTGSKKVNNWLGQQGGVDTLPGQVPQPFGANTMGAGGGARPPISGAAARLLAKSANEKMANINSTINETKKLTAKDSEPAVFQAQTLADVAVLRAQEAERNKNEEERNKHEATRIKVTVLACKHLPKMDTFGNTDAYCVVSVDNKKAGGTRMKRKTQVVKNSLNPTFTDQWFVFSIVDYPTQEVGIEVWDFDAGHDDEKIGRASIPLAALAKQDDGDVLDGWYEFSTDAGPVWGLDGSKAIVQVRLERNADPDLGLRAEAFVPDPKEVRELDAARKPWESAVRGLMFDVENYSEFPVVVTGMQAACGRGRDAPCSYTIYRTVGTWDVDRCPCHRQSPFKYMWCCCGTFPSGKPSFGCMKQCCRYTPCGSQRQGCCCWGECGPGDAIAEPCCEGCIPCCTGDCVINKLIIPCCLLLCSCGCGCCAHEDFGGLGVPGIPAFRLCQCCGCECCRNGVHRHHHSCHFCGVLPCNCTCNSTCCSCCRAKYHDRRRWTRVCSGRVDLPSDWGKFARMPSMQDFEDGGVLIPPKSRMGFYIHTPYPEDRSAEHALAIRGPFTKGLLQGDVSDQDEFLKLRTGPCTAHPIPFANSHRVDSSRDGQFYRLANQKLDRYKVCAFVGKVEYVVLPKEDLPKDCVTLCSYCRPCC